MAIRNTLQGHRPLALRLRKELGLWLRQRREHLGLTLQDVSSRVGYQYYNYIYAVEAGKSTISGEKHLAYASALELDPKDFMNRLLQAYDPWAWDILFGSGRGAANITADASS